MRNEDSNREGAHNHTRIMWYIDGNERYGVRRATLTLANALRNNGYEVHFTALYDDVFAAELTDAHFQVTVFGVKALPAWSPGIFPRVRRVVAACTCHCRTIPKLWRILVNERINWVHFRRDHHILPAGLACRLAGIRACWHLPNRINSRAPFGLRAKYYRLLCRLLGILAVANSHDTADSLGLKGRSRRVLLLGVDSDHFSPRANFESLSLPFSNTDDRPVFCVVARLVHSKAQDWLVQVWSRLRELHELPFLCLVGGPLDSRYALELVSEIKKERLQEHVFFAGQTADPRPFYAASSVVINSRRGPEPFGLSIIEAMMMGKPVLALNQGGPAQSIIDGETGWLINDCSADGFYKGVVRALNDRSSWNEMGQKGRRRACQLYSADTFVKNYIEVMDPFGKRQLGT